MINFIFLSQDCTNFIHLSAPEEEAEEIIKVFTSSGYDLVKTFDSLTGFELDPLTLDRID